jgi:CBS domain-containing protein
LLLSGCGKKTSGRGRTDRRRRHPQALHSAAGERHSRRCNWFAASPHRRTAILADGGRYAGSLTPAEVFGDTDAERPAVEIARHGPTVAPDAPASAGQELARSTNARRVPVVGGDGRVHGIISVTEDLTAFCGAPPSSRNDPR